MEANERRERDVRRTESFSDVVIGFSLAQIGVALVVPTHAAELVAHAYWFYAFLWTFALVCLMWWNHHRLFRTVFVPTVPAIVLNFVLLATIVLLTYFANLLNRPGTWDDIVVATRLYYGALSANFLVWAALVAICLRDPENDDEEPTVRNARRGMVVNGIAGALQLGAVFGSFLLHEANVIVLVGAMVPVSFIASGFAATLLGFRRVRVT